jgi:hypothetical protein
LALFKLIHSRIRVKEKKAAASNLSLPTCGAQQLRKSRSKAQETYKAGAVSEKARVFK